MADLMIKYDEVRGAATKLRAEKDSMARILGEVKQTIKNLHADWQSSASEEMQTNFNKLEKVISDHSANIEVYAKFLDKTAETYQNLDDQIKQRASMFK